jgi:hypothetical protein
MSMPIDICRGLCEAPGTYRWLNKGLNNVTETITRRKILKSTRAATEALVLFTYVIKSSALSNTGSVAPSNWITVGCLEENLYTRGAENNIATFRKSIINGIYDNPTVEPSIDGNLAAILGREASARSTKLTMEELLKENKKLEVVYTGFKRIIRNMFNF